MSNNDRRQFLTTLLAGLVTAGTVVLARAVPVTEASKPRNDGKQPGPEERANRLASESPAASGREPTAFANRAFRNGGGGGGFRNGGFANGGGGGFRNGGFANGGGGGGFRNSGFANGGGGGFKNGAFRNF